MAFLYASLVVVTGPTVISPLLKQVAVDRRVATLLEGEGVLIDPVGAILAVVVLNTILNSQASPLEIVNGLSLRLGLGGAFIEQLPIKTWNQYIIDEQVKLGMTVLKDPNFSLQQAHLQALIRTGELLFLLIYRENSLQVVTAAQEWQLDDELIYLLHAPRLQLLKRLSGEASSLRLAIEQLPKVKMVPFSVSQLDLGTV